MIKKLSLIGSFFFLSFLVSCGDQNAQKRGDGKISERPYQILSGQNNEEGKDATFLSGNDLRALFIDPIAKDVNSSKNFKLSFDLKDREALTFIAFADDKLRNGVELVFKRVGSQMHFHSVVNGVKSNHKNWPLEDNYPISFNSVYCDVHNDKDNAHVLVWAEKVNSHTPVVFLEEKANFNSEREGFKEGRGEGTYMGLKLDGALVHSVEVTPSRLVH